MDRIRLSIPMSVNADPGIDECPGILMVLYAPAIRTMISRIEKVADLKKQDSDVYALSRHTFSLTVFDRLGVSDLLEDVDLFAEEIVELTPEQYDLLVTEEEKGNTLGYAGEAGASVRVECRQEHYMEDGVYFTALVKHTSIELESQCLKLEALRKYLDRLDDDDDDSEEFDYPGSDPDRERFGNE